MEEKLTSRHVENTSFNPHDPETARLVALAREGDEIDASLTIRQALKKYKTSVFWAMILSTALIMEGYDLVMVSDPPNMQISCLPDADRSTRSLVRQSSRTVSEPSLRPTAPRQSLQLGNRVYPTRRSSVNWQV